MAISQARSILQAPPASASPEELADWLELCVLASDDGIGAFSELERTLERTGSIDALPEEDDDESTDFERIERIVDDVAQEISIRQEACGGYEGAYPFAVEENHIELSMDPLASTYVFLLLLSVLRSNGKRGGTSPAKLFEELCAWAIANYLGGCEYRVHRYVFGFPRTAPLPGGFLDAVDELCGKLREGVGRKTSSDIEEKGRDMKDDGLDIVVWRDFADYKPGKLIVFGQCATGQNWKDKLTELRPPDRWCEYWMHSPPVVAPIRVMCVPHRVLHKDWRYAGNYGGILFERCRIAELVQSLPDALKDSCVKWCDQTLKHLK